MICWESFEGYDECKELHGNSRFFLDEEITIVPLDELKDKMNWWSNDLYFEDVADKPAVRSLKRLTCIPDDLQEFLGLLTISNNVVFFVGAGVSSSAGIPTFRSEKGLYVKGSSKFFGFDAPSMFYLSTIGAGLRDFLAFHHQFGALCLNASPTPTHLWIKSLVDRQKVCRIFNQNIDGIFARAGINSSALVNLHGEYGYYRCLSGAPSHAKQTISSAELLKMGSGQPVYCNKRKSVKRIHCGSVLIPDLVYFDNEKEQDLSKFYKQDKAAGVDLIVIVGTSLHIKRFNSLIQSYCSMRSKPRVVVIDPNKRLVIPFQTDKIIRIYRKADDVVRFFSNE